VAIILQSLILCDVKVLYSWSFYNFADVVICRATMSHIDHHYFVSHCRTGAFGSGPSSLLLRFRYKQGHLARLSCGVRWPRKQAPGVRGSVGESWGMWKKWKKWKKVWRPNDMSQSQHVYIPHNMYLANQSITSINYAAENIT
jgi:hypothetical protein